MPVQPFLPGVHTIQRTHLTWGRGGATACRGAAALCMSVIASVSVLPWMVSRLALYHQHVQACVSQAVLSQWSVCDEKIFDSRLV